MIYFRLNGCDISFDAKAPADITLKQLLKQCDRIKPDWCACGIMSINTPEDDDYTDLFFTYDDVRKNPEIPENDISCTIEPQEGMKEDPPELTADV
jgi:hypothetical protein